MIVDRTPAGRSRIAIVLAHGAGGHMDDRAMRALRDVLLDLDVAVVRFNFPYRERGSARPDPMPRLVESWRAVLTQVREELTPEVVIAGGRSMGGRAASMLAAEDATAADGLLLLAYPLHPPGHPEKLRAAHLAAIESPVLCFNGTRDEFCDRPLMQQVLTTVGSNWQMHWLDGADHGFHVLKQSGRTDGDVLAEVRDATGRWLERYSRSRSR
jgi:predicted alpha/beta-hydrolase family hydrolase